MEKLYGSFENLNSKIIKIKLYKYNVEAVRKFSFGTWTSRQHVFISIKTDNNSGYGENIITTNEPEVSLVEWQELSQALIGLSITQAMHSLRAKLGIWKDKYTEMTEMALIDLAGKEKGVAALSLLNLNERHIVPPAFVILSDDVAFVEAKIKESCSSKIVKVKLFGKLDLDLAIIKMVKKYAPRGKSYLIGDVNCGYRNKGEEKPLSQIALSLQQLYEAGLDACEDPAYLMVDEWVKLQEMVKPLSLIPDVVMRPSWVARTIIKKGMGDIYNIHPGSAGSILDAILLSKQVLSYGAKLMIGDDSLVGPSCTAWQQLAIALGASWVEAIEKKADSDKFFSCVLSINTKVDVNHVLMDEKVKGFGLSLDENKL